MATRFYSSVATEKTISTTAVTTGSTSITLNDKTGLPTVPFTLVLSPDTTSEEIVTCTANPSGTTYTVTRAEEGTGPAKDHAINNKVRHMITARDLTATQTHYDATSAHGATSAIVGISDAQTLTNKTYKINENVVLTSTSTELNVLDGITASTAELNYTDGVTSPIQTQINTVNTALTTVNTALTTNTPVGSITMWAGAAASPPTGWLVCNGQSTTGYTALAAIVGATVPDMQGLVPAGWKSGDDAFGTLKGTGGSKTSTAEHTHGIDHNHDPFTTPSTEGSHSHGLLLNDGSGTGTGSYVDSNPTYDARQFAGGVVTGAGLHQHTVDVPALTGTSGPSSVGATNGNLQPYFTLNFIIKH